MRKIFFIVLLMLSSCIDSINECDRCVIVKKLPMRYQDTQNVIIRKPSGEYYTKTYLKKYLDLFNEGDTIKIK
jgi:hypothetical protein